MAELTHFYADDNNISSTTGNTFVTKESVTGLAANTKYLIVARALLFSSSTTATCEMRISTADDSTIASKSTAIVEMEQATAGDGLPYLFVHSFTTNASPADVLLEIRNTSSTGPTVSADQMTLFLLDLDAISAVNLISTHYFDASDAGPTDTGADWDNDANAFDGSESTSATKNSTATGELTAEGTTAPTSGATIGAVQIRFLSENSGGGSITATIDEDSVGGTELGTRNAFFDTKAWTPWETLTTPAGGWTWQKVNDLAISFFTADADAGVFKTEVQVLDVNGLNYFEDAQAVSGDLLSKTADTTVMASLAGSDLGTVEHLILGYGRCDIANTGRFFKINLHHAYDSSVALERSLHQAEGEDVDEQRIVGFATRHKASSGTPNVTMFGMSENAGGGQNEDGGGYLIALPTSLFADFEHDFANGQVVVDGTETTIATTGSYTPTITGNHLIFGRSQGFGITRPTQLGRMWVESTTTEIRTGDSTPTHNQIWDSGKDEEFMATFQRYSITTAETFNLRAQGAAADFDLDHRWLIIVNLNKPAAGPTIYPPFPQRQRRAVRM